MITKESIYTNILISIFLIFIIQNQAFAQDGIPYSQISKTENGITTKAFIKANLTGPKKLKETAVYHYYHQHKFGHTQGGFTGYPLHGKIERYNDQNKLIEKGAFQNGLKHGIWQVWNEKGYLVSSTEWKKGEAHGKHQFYDGNGNLIEVKGFRKGQLHGKSALYQEGKIVERKRYWWGKGGKK